MQQGQSGQSDTGTRDVTYNVASVLYHALQGVENNRIYAQDAAGDQQLRDFFEQACRQQQEIADKAKQLLAKCLQDESGPSSQSSAFTFEQGQQGQQGPGGS